MVPEEGDPIGGQIAGFIVWLAEQRYDPDYRYRCPWVAERFLRWQARRRRQALPSDLNAYCRERAIEGLAEFELEHVRRVVGDLRRFLTAKVV